MRWIGITLFFASSAAAQWMQFRGPNGSGVSPAASKLPITFSPHQGYVWKTSLPPGHSSPVVAGDRIFLTAAEGGARAGAARSKVIDQGGHLYTICLDRRTGAILWKKEAPRPRIEEYQPTNSPPPRAPLRMAGTSTCSSAISD